MKTIIFDIDNTLADLTDRLHYIQKEPKDWDSFHDECGLDAPIQPTIDINVALFDAGYHIVLLTGREERNRKATIDWCHKYGVKFHELLMRPNGNRRLDTELKLKLAKKLISAGCIHSVFEDRNRVAKMWREQGLTCYHVTEGDF